MKKILAYTFVIVALPVVFIASLCLSLYHTIILVFKETPEQLFNLIMNDKK
jgi:hypothetical protein